MKSRAGTKCSSSESAERRIETETMVNRQAGHRRCPVGRLIEKNGSREESGKQIIEMAKFSGWHTRNLKDANRRVGRPINIEA